MSVPYGKMLPCELVTDWKYSIAAGVEGARDCRWFAQPPRHLQIGLDCSLRLSHEIPCQMKQDAVTGLTGSRQWA